MYGPGNGRDQAAHQAGRTCAPGPGPAPLHSRCTAVAQQLCSKQNGQRSRAGPCPGSRTPICCRPHAEPKTGRLRQRRHVCLDLVTPLPPLLAQPEPSGHALQRRASGSTRYLRPAWAPAGGPRSLRAGAESPMANWIVLAVRSGPWVPSRSAGHALYTPSAGRASRGSSPGTSTKLRPEALAPMSGPWKS
jgi:hypothetical protein